MEDEDFIPPTDGTVVETKNKNSFVPPSDAVELKKKPFFGLTFYYNSWKWGFGTEQWFFGFSTNP